MYPQFIPLPKKAKDITGQRFGRLVALGPIGYSSDNRLMWLCQCDCGEKSHAHGGHLRSGHTHSCGCLHREVSSDSNKKHGMKHTPIYDIWCGIIQRCTSPNHKAYANYGGRGISICDEWRHDFQAFYDYVSQLDRYGSPEYTLDRADNNGNYEPGNLRWSTDNEQARNKRNNRLLTFNDKTQCVAAWAEEIGISASALHLRIFRRGWSVERALTTPIVSHS